MYFEINSVLHSKISMILVFLELVIQDSDQVNSYFIVNAEIDLKTNTFLKMAWGTSRKKKICLEMILCVCVISV